MSSRKWRTDSDTEASLRWRVSEKYWFERRGVSEGEYEIIIRGCTCSGAGFCESCMGKEVCEKQAKTVMKLRKVKNHHLYQCAYPYCAATKRDSCVGCKAHHLADKQGKET